VVEKIRKEVSQMGRDESDSSYDYIRKLKYSNAVFSETLRLYPSVPKNAKICVNDDVLPDGE
jgi:cytochrome P450